MFSTKNDFDPQGLHYTPVLPHPNLAVIDAIRELMREMGAAYARIHLGLCGWSDWEPSSLLVHALLILDTPISAGYFECLTDSAHSEAAAFVGRHPRLVLRAALTFRVEIHHLASAVPIGSKCTTSLLWIHILFPASMLSPTSACS